MTYHDGVRKRIYSVQGFMPYAFPIGGGPTQVTTTALALAASQGSVAIPVALEGHMLIESVSFWNTDAATARGAIEYGLFEDRLDNSNSLDFVDGGSLASWTPTVASLRTIPSASAGTYVPPGLYWLVLKNNGSATLGIGVTPAGTMANNTAQTKTLTGVFSFGGTLDFVAATWTKIATVPGVRLNGRSFGQATAF